MASHRLFYVDTADMDSGHDTSGKPEFMSNGRATLAHVTRCLDERYKFWHGWIGALRQMAHVLAHEMQNFHLCLLDGVGHFPMIDDADAWTRAVLDMVRTEHSS